MTPFAQQSGNLPVNLVIGQKTSASGVSANQGGSPSANSLILSVANSAGQLLVAGLAIDGQGNLWVADVGNNRVLGFPSASLAAGTSLPTANVALGQNSFTSNSLPSSNETQTNLTYLLNPTGVASDSQGNLYVTDQAGRVIQYPGPQTLGESGKVVLGVPPTQTTNQIPSYPTASTLGSINSGGAINGAPQGVFVLNGAGGASVYVCDSPQNRVVVYTSLTVPASANSPVQNTTSPPTGQPSATTGQANQGQVNPSNQTLSYPIAGAINPSNSEMWIVDQGNHRVVAFANQGGGVYSTATRVIGQTDFIYGTANLIVGSEMWLSGYGGGVALDNNSTPPHLYIADSRNNRILAFNNAYNVGVGGSGVLAQKADLVIGQADLLHSTVNYPNGAAGQPSATGLNLPTAVAVDSNGNLWVADSGNSRAVRFPAPFAQTAGSPQTATLVLGQSSLTISNPGVSQYTMTQPFGLAIFADSGPAASGSLAVSDLAANRILVFNRPSGGDFSSGQEAEFVIGQASFSQASAGNTTSQLNNPRGLAVDSGDRLYVADSANNRLIVFSKPTANNPSAPLQVPGLNAPQDVIVSFLTGASWVTNTSSSAIYQLPEFGTLDLNPTVQTAIQEINSFGPLAVALDPADNLIVADSANRLTFYFGQLFYRNTANYSAGIGSAAGPTPGMLVEIGLENSSFNLTPSYGTNPVQNLPLPWQSVVNNVQVTVNGIAAPIFRIDPNVISFQIPNEAPSSGPAEFAVTNTSTGQVLGVNSGTYNMQVASPGIYTSNTAGTGQVAANVYDSKGNLSPNPNSPSNPVSVGGYIGLWLTGAGYVSGLPADGTAPGSCSCPIQGNLTVVIGGTVATASAAVSPQFPGVWQVNAQIPAGTPSSTISPVSVVVELGDFPSNIGGNTSSYSNGSPGPDIQLEPAGGSGPGAGLITTIYVK